MKKIILIAFILLLTLGTMICILGFRREIQAGGAPSFLRAPETAAASAPLPAPSPAPVPAPVAEDPAQWAEIAWETLFAYPAHEAPVRVLALFKEADSPGDALYQRMLTEGKLMAKGAYYANADGSPKNWTQKALKGVSIGLLDSIYAETPELALAAYEALREAGRNDSVEVICAGITEDVMAAMKKDRFSMGAAAGVYQNQIQVIYAEDLMRK